jgi:hypothetical protein
VPNRAHKHPYQAGLPDEYQDVDRWFLLDASVNMQEHPWEFFWPVNVFALALVQGQKPTREWLVYAHSPLGERKGVEITLPDYGKIQVDVSVGGSFYHVIEAQKQVDPVR